MNFSLRTFLALALGTFIVGCDSGGGTFTLYRNSVTNENMRIHVASFNAADGEAYNRGNCEQAQLLFQAQLGVKAKFWCEKGCVQKVRQLPNMAVKRDCGTDMDSPINRSRTAAPHLQR